MGYYINKNSKGELLTTYNKAQQLIKDGAELTDSSYKPNLICVIVNFGFDAAGYCYDEQERDNFANPEDDRPKIWLVHPLAAELSDYHDPREI